MDDWGGAEIMDDRFRMRIPSKYKVEDYYTAQKAILEAGMGSTATTRLDLFVDERLSHLERHVDFSMRLASVCLFLCWTYAWNNISGENQY